MNDDISDVDLSGGSLAPEEHYSLMTILHSVLAIEARTNHLLHRLNDEGKITKNYRESVNTNG